jgi:glycerol-3-phosphate dehydrogenase
VSLEFSGEGRAQIIRNLASNSYDLLIIGGGITGAGILLDATIRGIRAAVIDMQDFAAGTSSRSTKLVHGGLRYLKQFEIGLVAEVGKERAIVYGNGRHVTTPVRMMLPIVEAGSYGKLSAMVGLWLYDRLAGVMKNERNKMLSAREALNAEPLLRADRLKGAGSYVEYRTDDARLTLEVMKAAVQRGGKALNYVKAQEFLYDDKHKIIGVHAVDQLTGEQLTITATTVVSATGPWVDDVRERDGSKQGKTLHLTKGVHVVIDHKRFPLRHAIYFDVPDGRMVFAIPRDGKTYVGTTDTDYHGDFTEPAITTEDRDYLLRAVNDMFPDVHLQLADIESGWAGLRPLIHEAGKSASEISRKEEVFVSDSGLISIAGGKLTGYRKMAEKVVNLVAKKLSHTDKHYPACTTDKIPISGGDFADESHFNAFMAEYTKLGTEMGLSTERAHQLCQRYGTNVKRIYEILGNLPTNYPDAKLPPDILSTLIYGMEAEMVCTPADYFVRRTGGLYFDVAWVRVWQESVTDFMSAHFNWSPSLKQKLSDELSAQIQTATQAR